MENELKDSYQMYKDDLGTILAGFSGQQNTLVIPRVFVEFLGSLETALFFHQCLYWSDRAQLPSRWFYKTYNEWHDELGLSEYQIRKCAKALKPYLVTTVRKAAGSPTVHYQVQWDSFSVSILEFLRERNQRNFSIQPLETSGSLKTEITSETTHTLSKGGVFPEWFSELRRIKGFDMTYEEVLAWGKGEGISVDVLSQTAYAYASKYGTTKKYTYKRVVLTYKNWCLGSKNGRSPQYGTTSENQGTHSRGPSGSSGSIYAGEKQRLGQE